VQLTSSTHFLKVSSYLKMHTLLKNEFWNLKLYFTEKSEKETPTASTSTSLCITRGIQDLLCSSIKTLQHRKKLPNNWRIKNQIDATCYFIVLPIGSTCFGHYYAHHQELKTVTLITTSVVSFLVCCRLKVRCGECGVVSGLQAIACLEYPLYNPAIKCIHSRLHNLRPSLLGY